MKNLDELVSIEVFDDSVNIKDYSTDISEAFKLLPEGTYYNLGLTTVGDLAVVKYYCEIFDGSDFVRALGNTQAIAICIASLKVRGVDYEG